MIREFSIVAVNSHSSFVVTNDKGQMTIDNPRAVFHDSNKIAIEAVQKVSAYAV